MNKLQAPPGAEQSTVEPGSRGIRSEAGPLVIFLVATVGLTWPLAVTGGAASLRHDYLSNIWNIWWVREALFERGVSPFATDLLYHPIGISLARHTLSPINSFLGALLSFVTDLHGAYRWLLLGHFWFSASPSTSSLAT